MKEIIVISGINLYSGGTLSIFYDCLDELVEKDLVNKYSIIIFVHKKELFDKYKNSLKIIELPKSRKSWLFRLYYEYYYFFKYSKKNNIYLWISIHDMTPHVKAQHLITYCHNPSFAYKGKIRDFKLDKKFYLFTKFYKYLYKINIKKNDYVIVQQNWISETFKKIYEIENILIFPPNNINIHQNLELRKVRDKHITTFVFPSLPRVFKNFEVICKACQLILDLPFKVILTIDGSENKYSNYIFEEYKKIPNIEFRGVQPRNDIFKIYQEVDCLIFPSKLETWGLPITEAKQFNLPILCADLPYAHETVGEYNKVCFFNPNNEKELAKLMKMIISNEISFNQEKKNKISNKILSWQDLIKKINIK